MIKDFDQWYALITSDTIWHERASMNHKPETFRKVAEQVYTLGISDSQTFSVTPVKEHRNHVYNKLCKIQPDKVKKDWVAEAQKQQKVEQAETWVPLTGEERAKRLQEFKDMVDATPVIKPIRPVSVKEIIENSDWRPKPPDIKEPTEEEKMIAIVNHKNKLQAARIKVFREKYPTGTVKELQKYLKKFNDI